KQSLQGEFSSRERIALKGFEIHKMRVDGEQATLRVVADLAVARADIEKAAEKIEKKNWTVQLVKEGGGWKVWRCAYAAEDLAVALVKANSKAEQARLLADEKELVTGELGTALLTQGLQLSRQGNYTGAIEIYELARDLSEQWGDKKVTADALRVIGNVHLLRGDNAQALEQYQKSLKILEEIGDKASIAGTLRNIGNVHQRRGNYTEALEQYQKSLQISGEIGDKAGIPGTLNNIGIIHRV